MKKLIIALIFAQASCLSALPSWLTVDNLRKAEETVIHNAAKGTKYCGEGLLSVSGKLDSLATFIKDKATADQVKKYAYLSAGTLAALLIIYVLYKRDKPNQQAKANGTYPQSSGATNLAGNN